VDDDKRGLASRSVDAASYHGSGPQRLKGAGKCYVGVAGGGAVVDEPSDGRKSRR
jgi:hypothetical protein